MKRATVQRAYVVPNPEYAAPAARLENTPRRLGALSMKYEKCTGLESAPSPSPSGASCSR